MEKYRNIFGFDNVKCLTADREFIGEEWFRYLKERKLVFCIRIKNNSKTNRNTRVDRLFSFLSIGQSYIFPRKRKIYGHKLNIVGVRLKTKYLIYSRSYAVEVLNIKKSVK